MAENRQFYVSPWNGIVVALLGSSIAALLVAIVRAFGKMRLARRIADPVRFNQGTREAPSAIRLDDGSVVVTVTLLLGYLVALHFVRMLLTSAAADAPSSARP